MNAIFGCFLFHTINFFTVYSINSSSTSSELTYEEPLSFPINCTSTLYHHLFHCNGSDVCIPQSEVCNGIPQCPFAEDESVSQCGCLSNEFRCKNSCINIVDRCNRIPDCENEEDEQNCETHTCPVTHFKCSNHYCVPLESVCNFVNDCGDNSDELKCAHRSCWKSEFTCSNGQCIRPGFLCDGIENCVDGSDEADCEPESFVTCEDGYRVHKHYWCDDWPDCPDNHADELNCGVCSEEDRFLCSNGRCIYKANICDAQCDCLGLCEDEANCSNYYHLQTGGFTCVKGLSLMCSLPGQGRHKDRCIRKEFLCDGHNDCQNGNYLSDEYGCNVTTALLEQQNVGRLFQCKDGRYLPKDLLCDYKYDCLDGEDEENCSTAAYNCKMDDFRCDNGQCIDGRYWCDRYFDCWDKSDEIKCYEMVCPEGWTRCVNGGQCIPEDKWCDFHGDCLDFSDELNCEIRKCWSDEFQCDNGQCIDISERCINNGPHGSGCADKSHLKNCETWVCPEDYYKCHSGPCLNKSLVCNGNIDCRGTWDDEDNCTFSCSRSIPECQCRDVHINCTGLLIMQFPWDTEKEITWFHLSSNRLNETLSSSTFHDFNHMVYLDLSNNSITTLPPMVFSTLWKLNVLDLRNNEIQTLSDSTFCGLSSLKGLHLEGNEIKTIEQMAFYGLSSLPVLDLSGQDIEDMEEDSFIGLRNLLKLDLSRNSIKFLKDATFVGMPKLLYLDLSKNELKIIEANVFRATVALQTLITDEFRFCCLARHVASCYPPPDEFSSCEDLMSNIVLRVCIWILGIVATFANLLVIIFRASYKNSNSVHSFLITNLAIGDLLMGAYLLIIAFVDWHYRGIYFIHDSDWRSSQLCSIAGFISTFSSELSVFTLTVITLDRFLVIIFPFRRKRLAIARTRILMASGWILAAVISVLPLPILQIRYFDNFYGRSGVCLPLHITPDKPNGWEYSVFVFIFLNFLSFSTIAGSYIWMYLAAKITKRAVKRESHTSESSMAFRMSLLVATDAACWIPIIMLGVWSIAGFTVPSQMFAWVAVFILPLNAALNPILYTMSTAPFMKPARNALGSFHANLSSENKKQTSVMLNKYNSADYHTAEEMCSVASRPSSVRWQRKIDTVVIEGEVMPLRLDK